MGTKIKDDGKNGRIVLIYAQRSMDAQGRLIYEPLKIVAQGDEVEIAEAHRMTGLSCRQLQNLCISGDFKTARRKSPQKKSAWMIARWEVLGLQKPPAD